MRQGEIPEETKGNIRRDRGKLYIREKGENIAENRGIIKLFKGEIYCNIFT